MSGIGDNTEEYQSPIVRFGIGFFGILLIVCAPFAGYGVVCRFLEARASLQWPTVSGTVIESSVNAETVGVDTPVSEAKGSYAAVVRYEYRVGDRVYKSQQISHSDVGYGDRGPAEAIVQRYPAQTAVTVYHDPQDPKESVLEPGLSWKEYLFLLLPVVMLIFGAAFLHTTRTLGKQAAERRKKQEGEGIRRRRE